MPPNAVDIVFRTKERGRWKVSSSTELGNNEGTANANVTIRNVFGGAETLTGSVSLGTKTKRSFSAGLSIPVGSELQSTAHLSLYGLERDQTSYASCFEGLRGFRATLKGSADKGGVHEMGYEATFRHIRSLTPTASLTMRAAAGETLKSSIFHSWAFDSRDDKVTATRGHYLKLYHEFAGLGGDASFYKTEVEGQISRPLAWGGAKNITQVGQAVGQPEGSGGVSVSFGAKGGLLLGLNKPLLFSDKFQLGGPTSVRSYKVNGLGPHDGGRLITTFLKDHFMLTPRLS